MAFHLIITCVSQKNSKKEHSILDPNIITGSIEDVFYQWQSTLTNSKLKPKTALKIYKGNLWNAYLDAWGIINNRHEDAKLWILSAGYGLINANEKIIIDSKQSISIQSTSSTYIFSEKTVEVIGNSICNLYGGLVEILDGPSTIKGSRTLIPGFPATAREYLQTLKNILGG